MSDLAKIGVNTSWLDHDLYIGKKIGTFGSGEKGKQEAKKAAENTMGSELIYQTTDGNWNVAPLTQKDITSNTQNYLDSSTECDLEIDSKLKNEKNIINYEFSFVDEMSDDLKIANRNNFSDYPAHIEMAKRENVEPGVFIQLATKSRCPEARMILAANPTTPPEALRELARRNFTEDQKVHMALVNNPNTWKDSETVKLLLESRTPEVRNAVIAYNNEHFKPNQVWPVDETYSPSVKIN